MPDQKKTTELLQEVQALRKKVEFLEALHSQKMTQEILDGFTSAVIVKDAEGRYLFVNAAFQLLAGLEKKDLIGKTAEHLFATEYAARVAQDDQEVLRTGNRVTGEVSLPLQGKLRHFILEKFPLFDLDGRVVSLCGIYQDAQPLATTWGRWFIECFQVDNAESFR